MRKVFCDYCGQQAEYVDSKIIYGRSYGMMYLCRTCMAYVGVHKGTDKPLGRWQMPNYVIGKSGHMPFLIPCGNMVAFADTAMRPMAGWPIRWGCPLNRPTSACLI